MKTFAACLLLVAGLPAAALADQWTRHWEVSGEPDLHVNTGDAAVVIRAGTGHGIEAEVHTEGVEIGPRGVRIEEHVSGNRVELTVKDPQHLIMSFHVTRIRVELRVPENIRGEFRTGDGPIDLLGIRGTVDAHTGDGPVKVEDFDGALRAQTGDGPVTVGGRFKDLWIQTGDGPVTIAARSGSMIGNGWHLQTGDGPVNVSVPASLAANVDLHSGDGPIRFDLPMMVRGTQDKHNVHGSLNGGGAPLSIHTGDGPITIGRS